MQDYLSAVEDSLQAIAAQGAGFFKDSLSRDSLIQSANQILGSIVRDVERLRQESGVLFAMPESGDSAHMSGHRLARLFTGWRKNPPGTVALILVTAEHFGISADNKNLQAAILAGIAADIRNDNPYHNNSHFREVTAMMARLCAVNNTLASQGVAGATALGADDISLCLASAAAHDLLHDGKGNSPNGPDSHEQYRLENKSIAALEPLMELAGMDAADRERARTIIRITDVTAKPGQMSPHKIMRQVFAEALDENKAQGDTPVPAELATLKTDKNLLMMAALMSDADLGPSAATNYLFNREQSRLLNKENPDITVTDKSTMGFLNFIMDRQFTSLAGSCASGTAINDIFNKASTRNDRPRAVGVAFQPVKKQPLPPQRRP